MFKRTKVCTGVLLALGGAVMATSMPAFAQDPQRVEITGSRIKRVDAEGSLPVTTITREQLEATGTTTVAEFVRSLPFAQAGNYRPQSGSSFAGYAGADLRGLGADRTLVLLDGRRLPKAAQVGSATDLNSIPMAAIERVEILTDGASAIYGSDAIGGVMNFITRKDFEGVSLTAGYTDPVTKGGSKRELSAIIGLSGDDGRIVGGFTNTKRAMVFTRDRPWGAEPGISTFGNNYVSRDATQGPQVFTAVPGACTDQDFYEIVGDTNTTCSYNFNAVAADELQVENTAIFLRGEYYFSPDWSAYVNTSVSRVQGFGRYAPVPAAVVVDADSPNNPSNGAYDITLRHRFAAAGNRDDYSDANLYDFGVGVRGRVADRFDVEFGMRKTESSFNRLGYNYIVIPLAEQYINSGEYDIFLPSLNDPGILNTIKATISRKAVFSAFETYASVATDLFGMGGGNAVMYLGIEHRNEKYDDKYDSLSEAGVIGGSAGNSAGGTREVAALSGELLLPISKTLEGSLSARYEKYSDYGSDFSPKASLRFKALPNLVVRGSVGKGFRAPSLDILTQQTTFSAESVFDPQTCIAFGGAPAACNSNQLVQVDSYFTANPSLSSEQSTQYSFGVIWDATPSVSVKADYWNIKIDDVITTLDGPTIVDRANGRDPLPIPAGLGVTRNPINGAITRLDAGYANEGELKTSGLDFNVLASWNSGFGRFRHELTWSHMFNYKTDGVESAGTQGYPEDRISITNGWMMGAFEANWNINVIGKHGEVDEGTNIGTYTTHDIQVNWTPPLKGAKLTVGVLNAFDKRPTLVPYDGRNFNFYLFDSYGAQPYVRFTQKF